MLFNISLGKPTLKYSAKIHVPTKIFKGGKIDDKIMKIKNILDCLK